MWLRAADGSSWTPSDRVPRGGRRTRRVIVAGAMVVLATTLAGAAPGLAQDAGTVTLAAYTTPREVYETVIPMFGTTEAGAGVAFEQSYSGSGDQSRAVESGLPADVVALSLWPDVERLVEPGIVGPDWDENAYGGMVSDSIVVFIVRPGNPKGVTDWDDLVRDDVNVITPNPFTSGGAQWNLLAAYGAQTEVGRSEDEAREYLRALIANTSVMDRSAREALTTFIAGQGDVLISYENEAIFAQQAGQPVEYVIPSSTILIENPVAVTLTGDAPEAAQAFVDFLYTPEAQRVFAERGYRPVLREVLDETSYVEPDDLFTIADMGGWIEARERFFDPESGIVAGLFAELGRD